ncbi:rho guanine nucleotide exchange factor 3 [Biomphalaria glabrata]|uniref:DH domain-containing protein n=1 Tax=Biomphalaria glabrata TaxID=6526 RepID=A0A2C9LY04_BIOGL|nr:rho guanine nucleotide exchange factor 3 [Biomphalaria glabrata]
MTPNKVTFADDSQDCLIEPEVKMKGADGAPRSDLTVDVKPKKRRNSGSDVEISGDENENCRIRFLSVRQKKSKRSLLRVSTSLVNLISPGRHHQKQQQDPDGFKVPCSPSRQPTSPYKPPQPSPAKRRQQVSWVDSFAGGQNANTLSAFSHVDIKRQEAIYELYQGEKDMLEDLANVAKLYRDTLVTLGLMTASDVCTLFGNIDNLIPVHRDLLDRLEAQRKPDGTSMSVGKEILEWTNKLSAYVTFCANQIKAKEIFDEKKNEPALNDFYQRCQASPFSRKLDLWSLLDGARGRFVKYPLLIRSIAKYTLNDREEAENLEQSIKEMETIIQEADEATGLARCEHAKSLLIYLYDDQRVSAIQESQAFVCSGCMKNTKGSKLHVFLFDKVLLVSRSCSQSGKQMYQIYRQPIPTAELLVQDLPDGEVKLGSFRNAFGQGGLTGKNVIRLSFMDTEKGQTHTLIANDEHDKRQWMQAFHKVTSNIVVVPESKNKDKPSS